MYTKHGPKDGVSPQVIVSLHVAFLGQRHLMKPDSRPPPPREPEGTPSNYNKVGACTPLRWGRGEGRGVAWVLARMSH